MLKTLPPLPPIKMAPAMASEETQTTPENQQKHGYTDDLIPKNLFQYDQSTFDAENIPSIATLNRIGRNKRIHSGQNELKYYEPELSSSKQSDTFITQPPEIDSDLKKKVLRISTDLIKFPELEETVQPLLKMTLQLEGPARRTEEMERRIAELQKAIAEMKRKRHV